MKKSQDINHQAGNTNYRASDSNHQASSTPQRQANPTGAAASPLPTHLGFIVDGNRRWARERNLPTLEGHQRGFRQVEVVIDAAIQQGIKYLSFYLFSTENWGRSAAEVSYLMDLARIQIKRLTKQFQKHGLRAVILGRPQPVPPDLWQELLAAESATKANTAGTICLCFNYGGQQEIVDAVNAIISGASDSRFADTPVAEQVTPSQPAPPVVTAEAISQHLYHPEVPPVDMIVRTSGEQRISGFMLWRAAYAEFLFLPKYFPDITAADVTAILAEYTSRSRRFGK